MAGYRLHEKALAVLDRLCEHGILTFGLRQANEYYDDPIAHFQDLVDAPRLYQAVDSLREGYRRSVFGVHSIYYRIAGADVVIVRILGRENPDTAL